IVGMDVVEAAPAYDQSETTALAAATLALEMLSIQAATKGEQVVLPDGAALIRPTADC
ncbi:arginase family protein, partial [Salmonella enterica]|uniref:arginase family protein n=1 Tax=Salmonella enterica TaxID=28901 RepID=UPI000941958F